jgi:predicted small secreted protein
MRLIPILLVILSAFALASAAGCETMKGFGKDITDASTSVQQTFFE